MLKLVVSSHSQNFNIFVNADAAANPNANARGSTIALPVFSYRRAKNVLSVDMSCL